MVIRDPSLIAITTGEDLAATRAPGMSGHAGTPPILTKLPSSSKEEELEIVAIGCLANAQTPTATTITQM